MMAVQPHLHIFHEFVKLVPSFYILSLVTVDVVTRNTI